MAAYRIVPREDRFFVEIDEGGEQPRSSGLFQTEADARAYIEDQQRIERVGERWASSPLGSRLNRD